MVDTREKRLPSSQDVERGFALVKAARAVLQELPERVVSENTAKKYASLTANLRATRKRPEEAAGTRRSYYVYRAALNYVLPLQIRECLRTADRLAKAKDRGGWWAEVLRIRELLQTFQRYLPDPNGERIRSGERSNVPLPRGASRSKRKGLRKLPEDWRDRLWRVVPSGSKYRSAIATSLLTGVRPAELAKGVDIRLSESGDLIFDIRGAKTQGGRYGQAARRLIVSATGPVGTYLKSMIDEKQGIAISIRSPRLFGNQLSAFAKKCWPKRSQRVSPYTIRHQFAADLKAMGDADAVSMALGHAVADTAQHYGTARQARSGGGKLVAVETTRALKKERILAKAKSIEAFAQRKASRGRWLRER